MRPTIIPIVCSPVAPSTWGMYALLAALGCLPVGQVNAAPQSTTAIENVTIYTQSSQGTLERATVLVRDGKIVEVGTQVRVPVSARIIDGQGKTLIPSLIAIVHPVALQREVEGESRTIVVRGRPVTLGGRSPATNTVFARVAENLPSDAIDWRAPLRAGITTMHLIAPGYCQTAIATPGSERDASVLMDEKYGQLHIALTNSSQSLDLLRNNLKPPQRTGSNGPPGAASPSGGRRGSPGREPGPSGPSTAPPPSEARSPAPTSTTPPEPTIEQKLWEQVREGKANLWVAVNNSAAILHALAVLKEHPKVKVIWVVNGPDAFQTLSQFPAETSRLVLGTRIDLIPNSRARINVPALVQQAKLPFSLTVGTRAAELDEAQAAPMFALAMLAKTGLGHEEALKAITLRPAQFLGIDGQVGSIEPGKQANMILFDGSPFDAATTIHSVFLEGKPVYED